jgi:peptidoglycan/xylan/chitin deacetylase (PgdA/CDA1 family)
VLANLVQDYSDLIKNIHEDGHEIASHGYSHANLSKLNDDQVLYELQESKIILENTIHDKVHGFRAPCMRFPPLYYPLLSKLGYDYDSSVVPSLKIPGWYGNPHVPWIPYVLDTNGTKSLMEFPISVFPILRLPSNGGWYLRNVGKWWINLITTANSRFYNYAMLYIHPWEFSTGNPPYPEIPFHVFRKTGIFVRRFFQEFIQRYKLQHEDLTINSLYEKQNNSCNLIFSKRS